MSSCRHLAALLVGISILFAGCMSTNHEASGPSEPQTGGGADPPRSTDPLPGTHELRQLFQDVETDLRDPDARRASPPVRQKGEATVLGVYPVRARERCHLIEVRISGLESPFDFGAITQPMDGVGRSFWQVPWMEVLLSADGTRILARSPELSQHRDLLRGDVRVAFFLHDLDLTRALETPFGNLDIPEPSRRPSRLRALRYEEPD